ncbi:uncharacterized protein [Ptychodera flava]|uniref:uncharacterized protein isoform X2 n=1 Tax=Ptychodera flava TaxID=63121 RepID=UPI00396A7A3C
MLKVKARKTSEDVKEMLINFISEHEDVKVANPGEEAPERPGQMSSEGHSHEQSITPNPGHSNSEPKTKRRKFERGHMLSGEHSDESNVNPSPNTSKRVSEAKRAGLAGGDGSQKDNQGTASSTNNGSDGDSNPNGKNQHQNTQDAADALWNAYSSGRLDRMADKTFLSIPILDDIGARMLSLETFVDYQEYLQCKEEIRQRDITCQVSSEGHKSPDDVCDVDLVSIMNMEAEKQAKEQNISIQWKQIEVKMETKDKLQSTVFSDSQTFSESEKSCIDEWVTLKRGIKQSSDKLVLKKDGKKLKQQMSLLTNDMLLMKNITKKKVEELSDIRLSHERLMKGIVPKHTVRRLSRYGNAPGEVLDPQGLTINQSGHVVVSDRGPGDQPGSVKTVTADTAQIISTITFHGLSHIFRPRDVKISKNNLYYIADDGNKCILVCDAKSRLKQIIDIGEVGEPMICLGPDNTVFVTDWNGRVIKYSEGGEMISSKQLSRPYDLTMNSKYQLIVSCQDEHCIYVLDSNLNTLYTFGHEHLVNQCGVSVDSIGENIYVADENKVKIFSALGEYLTDVTVDGNPEFITVFADGGIVYTDNSDDSMCVIFT